LTLQRHRQVRGVWGEVLALEQGMVKPKCFSVFSLILVLAGLAGAGMIVLNKPVPPAAEGPRIFIPGCAGERLKAGQAQGMHLGEGKPGDLLDGTFMIRNIGSKPLTFQLKAGCRCAWVTPAEGSVEPGGEQAIHVGVRLRKKGQDENSSIWITSNDVDAQTVGYPISARCPKGFLVEPAALHFGNVLKGTASSQLLKISRLGADGDVRCLQLTTSGSAVKLSRRQSAPDTAQWDVVLASVASPGDINATIRILAADGEEQVVPVFANVCQPLLGSPRSFFLPAIRDQKEDATFSCIVTRFDGKPLARLTKVELPRWLEASDACPGHLAARLIQFRVTGRWPSKVVSTGVRARLFFATILEPLEVIFFPAGAQEPHTSVLGEIIANVKAREDLYDKVEFKLRGLVHA
jgi:hypothetical protein